MRCLMSVCDWPTRYKAVNIVLKSQIYEPTFCYCKSDSFIHKIEEICSKHLFFHTSQQLCFPSTKFTFSSQFTHQHYKLFGNMFTLFGPKVYSLSTVFKSLANIFHPDYSPQQNHVFPQTSFQELVLNPHFPKVQKKGQLKCTVKNLFLGLLLLLYYNISFPKSKALFHSQIWLVRMYPFLFLDKQF